MLQTKSGTRTLHGNAFRFFRNDKLNARNFFAPTVPALKQNIFGYNVGRPLHPGVYGKSRDKTFSDRRVAISRSPHPWFWAQRPPMR